MPILTDREYSKLAAAAAKDLVDSQIPLNDSIDKLAASYDMNDDQLARLCEASNNAAFNALFEARGKQGADDRLVEFDVASPKTILEKRIGAAKTASARQPSSSSFDAAWESRPLRSALVEHVVETEKVASVDVLQEQRFARADARSVDKALEHLRHEKIAAEADALEALSDVVRHFRPMYARDGFTAFEKEAMILHGQDADALLDATRRALRMPEVTRSYEKVAHLVVTNDKTAAHRSFQRAVHAQRRVTNIQTALERHGRS